MQSGPEVTTMLKHHYAKTHWMGVQHVHAVNVSITVKLLNVRARFGQLIEEQLLVGGKGLPQERLYARLRADVREAPVLHTKPQ